MYDFTETKFTNAGAPGRFGPLLANVSAAYAAASQP